MGICILNTGWKPVLRKLMVSKNGAIMRTMAQQYDKQRGSAMILVVVVTVLLAVVGVMFVMVSRVGEMSSSAVVDSADLDAAVDSVVSRIHAVLVEDLFGDDGVIGSNGPHYTWPGNDSVTGDRTNPWLTSLEPSIGVDGFGVPVYYWAWVTDLYDNNFGVPVTPVYYDPQHELNDPTEWDGSKPELRVDTEGVLVKIIKPDDRTYVIAQSDSNWSQELPGARADASGDGVADSRWGIVPNVTTSRGRPVFAAVRIIDNCAMLNLNTANCFQINTVQSGSYDGWFYYNQLTGNTVLYNEYNTANDSDRVYYRDGGKYLSEVNYASFLRGSGTNADNLYGLHAAKKFAYLNTTTGDLISQLSPEDLHKVLMKYEDSRDVPASGAVYELFGIGDELEMRNRYLLTSRVLARFEKEGVAYNTFDWGRGEFVGGWNTALRVKRVPCENDSDLSYWKIRLNPENFDNTGTPAPIYPSYYDRRHISTFYSFDRPLRTGQYPRLTMDVPDEQQRAVFVPEKTMPIDLRAANIVSDPQAAVHLLYALREVYDPNKAAQLVVNLIDYADSDNDVSFLDTDAIADYIYAAAEGLFSSAEAEAIANNFGLGNTVAYGYERQPFISEIYCYRNPVGGNVERFGLELVNPYRSAISLDDWRISIGTTHYNLDATYSIPAATGDQPAQFGRLTIRSGSDVPTAGGVDVLRSNFGLGLQFLNAVIKLQRPDPAALNAANPFMVVDRTRLEQSTDIFGGEGVRVSKRDDKGWKFANNAACAPVSAVGTLGQANNVDVPQSGYQLPVANDGQSFERLADFIKAAFVGNQYDGSASGTITEQIASAASESDIRLDIAQTPQLLDYICFLNRPEGSLPGRININTAAKHVIAAAIAPQLVMAASDDAEHALYLAEQIIANRPYERISDLIQIDAFKKFAESGSPNVGDRGIEGDLEERDWIVSRLTNIFTVRSDTFTAWILVRLGHDGPQRRMIAVFDRSDVWAPGDRPRLVALHPVADPR